MTKQRKQVSIRNAHWEFFLNKIKTEISRKKWSPWEKLQGKLAEGRMILGCIYFVTRKKQNKTKQKHQLIDLIDQNKREQKRCMQGGKWNENF